MFLKTPFWEVILYNFKKSFKSFWILNQDKQTSFLFIFTFQNFGMWQTTTLKRNLVLEIWRKGRKKVGFGICQGGLPPLKETFVGSLGFWVQTRVIQGIACIGSSLWENLKSKMSILHDILYHSSCWCCRQSSITFFKTLLVVILTVILRLAALAHFNGLLCYHPKV